MSIISGTINHGIRITASGSYASGLTITSTGLVSTLGVNTVYSAMANPALYNQGTVNNNYIYGSAVYFKSGGSILNTGLIRGGGYGVLFGGAAGTLSNSGTINAFNPNGFGVAFQAGGTISNSGTIGVAGTAAPSFGVYVRGAAGTVTNGGQLHGRAGIQLAAGGAVTNTNSGTITGEGTLGGFYFDGVRAVGSLNVGNNGLIQGFYGIDASGGPQTISNSGTILGRGTGNSGTNGYGILLRSVGSGAQIGNTGLIKGTGTNGVGIVLQTGSNLTVTNAGTISGGGLYAMLFNGTGSDRLIVDPGAVFSGEVKANGTGNTLELAAGAQTGTLALFGTEYLGFSQVVVDAGANWVFQPFAANSLSGVTITAAGSILLARKTGAGTLVAAGGGSIEFIAAVAGNVNAQFTGAGGAFVIDQMPHFSAPISGLVDGDRLRISTAHLGNFYGIDGATPGAFNGGSGTTPLTLTSGGTIVSAVTLKGNYQNDAFGVSQPVGGFVTVGMQINAATDFNGDGTGDVLFENVTNGQLIFAAMNNGTFSSFGAATGALGPLSAFGHGDINGDGFSDVVVEDPNSRLYIGEQNGLGNGQPTWVMGPQIAGYTLVGVGDIQGNGRADIVIQSASGDIAYLDTKGSPNPNDLSSNPHWVAVTNTPGFNVVGVGDVNGDGFADIVLQNPTTGEIDYINMAGGVAAGVVGVATTPGWNVKAVADLTGFGFADIVIQNPSSAGHVYYIDAHTGTLSWGTATPGLTPDYVVTDTADVFNNGHADLIIQQQSTGNTYYAQEGASGFVSMGNVTTALGSNYHVV